MHCCKWGLISRLFDLIANAKIDIIVFVAEIITQRAKISCAALVTSKNIINCLRNSSDKNLIELNNK